MKCKILLFMLLSASVCIMAEHVSVFNAGGWTQEDWVMTKSWRWPHRGQWVQEKDFIVNAVPVDATQAELQGKRAGEVFTAMLLKQEFQKNVSFSATMEFDYRMAPGLIIAAEPFKTEDGYSELRDHFEIILYDKGINVWYHYFVDGKQQWVNRAFLTADFERNKKYEVNVKLQFTRKGPQMTVQVGDHIFGFIDDKIPEKYRLGLVACEGINRFYDFKVK